MNLRTNIISALILILLGGWYYFYEIRGAADRETAEVEAKRLLPGLDPESITGLTLARHVRTGSGEELEAAVHRFTREAGTWMMAEPLDTPADPNILETIARSVANMQSHGDIADSIPPEDPFGLSHPAFTIDIRTQNETGGPSDHSILLGDRNPTGEYYYASMDHGPVILVSSTIQSDLTKDTLYYRLKSILPFSQDSLAMLEYTRRDCPVIRVTRDAGTWRMVQPDTAPADDGRIQEIINMLDTAQISSFFAETLESPGQYGLDTPLISLRIRELNSDLTRELDIGASDPTGKLYYAHRDGYAPVFSVPAELVDKLTGEPFDLRDKHVCNFERHLMTGIDIVSDSGTVKIVRVKPEGWQLVKPRELDTDAGAVGAFLSDLAYLRATGVKPESEPFGDTVMTVTLHPDPDEAPVDMAPLVITLGGRPDDGVGRWIRTSAGNTVFRIADSDLSGLKTTEFDFRNKTLMEYSLSELTQIRVICPDGEIVIADGDDGFDVVSPKDRDVPKEIVEGATWGLSRVSMRRIAAEPPENLQTYGLEPPEFTVTVTLKSETRGPLKIGSQVNADPTATRFVQLADQPVVGEISGEMPLALQELQRAVFSAE